METERDKRSETHRERDGNRQEPLFFVDRQTHVGRERQPYRNNRKEPQGTIVSQ
jgi:hypothetical protein